jgi:hypothetical protein
MEACRRNNTELLQEIIDAAGAKRTGKQSKEEAVATFLNAAKDGIGNYGLHVAASSGSCE